MGQATHGGFVEAGGVILPSAIIGLVVVTVGFTRHTALAHSVQVGLVITHDSFGQSRGHMGIISGQATHGGLVEAGGVSTPSASMGELVVVVVATVGRLNGVVPRMR